MINASENARELWKFEKVLSDMCGEKLASDLVVLGGVRSEMVDAFDLLAAKAEDTPSAQAAVHAFEVLWDILEQERQEILYEIEASPCSNPSCPQAGNCHGECVRNF